MRYTRHALDLREIRTHLENGKYPAQLGVCWNDRIGFLMTDKLAIKRVQFLDLGPEESQNTDSAAAASADPVEQFDADFALMTGELRALLDEIVDSLGGEAPVAAAA